MLVLRQRKISDSQQLLAQQARRVLVVEAVVSQIMTVHLRGNLRGSLTGSAPGP